MTILSAISIAANGDIRRTGPAHAGAAEYFTVIELHRHLQDLADDALASGDDIVDITDNDPSQRSTDNIITLINGYNIDDDLSEYLYDGSIIQAGGAEIYDGIVNFGNATNIQIIQGGALLTNDWWNTNDPVGLNADSGAGISHRFMIKVRTGGSDIDGRRLIGFSREFNSTYSEFSINGSTRGNNVLALSQANDLNNATAAATVATWASIVNNNEGYVGIDVTGDTVDEFYYSNWDLGSQSKNDFYERLKWLTRQGSTSTVYGLDQTTTPFRGITHEIDIDTPTGTFVEPESVSWGTGATAGTAQLFAINSTTAGTKMWIQLLSGVAPTDGLTITGNGGATCAVNTTVTSRTVPVPWPGASTGTAIIGSYGLGIETADLAVTDIMTDLTNTVRNPPNNVQYSVTGVVIGEDRVLVAPRSGSAIDTTQLTIAGPVNGAAVGSIVVNEAIPSDTPASGTIRVVNDSGFHIRLPYTSWATSTFTLTGTYDFSGADENDSVADTNGVYITYIDKLATATTESFLVVYNADRDLFVRVRDGDTTPIKAFESPAAVLTSTGGSIAAIRTADL